MAAYFHKKRAIASGIATSGIGFGIFIYPPIINLLQDNIDWTLTLMITGASVLLCIPLGLLFKPLHDEKTDLSTSKCKDIDDCGEKGSISSSLRKMGKGYVDLLGDAKFMLLVLSNLLTFIGFSTTMAFVVVIMDYRVRQQKKCLTGNGEKLTYSPAAGCNWLCLAGV